MDGTGATLGGAALVEAGAIVAMLVYGYRRRRHDRDRDRDRGRHVDVDEHTHRRRLRLTIGFDSAPDGARDTPAVASPPAEAGRIIESARAPADLDSPDPDP